MMADYFWTITGDNINYEYKRRSKKERFVPDLSNLVNPFDTKWLSGTMFLACFRDLKKMSKPKWCLGRKWSQNKIKYAKRNSKIISDAKYILLFHISSYVRFVILNRCQLEEIDSCIVFEEKVFFFENVFFFFQICKKFWDAIFGLRTKKHER